MSVPQCSFCGLQGVALFKCASCRAAQYCGKACQKTHWRVHKPSCSMVKPGKVNSIGFHLYDATEVLQTRPTQFQTMLHGQHFEVDETRMLTGMRIATSKQELRENLAKCKAESRMHQRQDNHFAAARCMHDCLLLYVQAEWWLDAKKAADSCKKLLHAHKGLLSTTQAHDKTSQYNLLLSAVDANAATIACRLDPVRYREKRALCSILRSIQQLHALEPKSLALLTQMRTLQTVIEAECRLLHEAASWAAYMNMQKLMIILLYAIFAEDDMENHHFALLLDPRMTHFESVLATHKDLLDASTYADHVEFHNALRSVSDEDSQGVTVTRGGGSDSRAATR